MDLRSSEDVVWESLWRFGEDLLHCFLLLHCSAHQRVEHHLECWTLGLPSQFLLFVLLSCRYLSGHCSLAIPAKEVDSDKKYLGTFSLGKMTDRQTESRCLCIQRLFVISLRRRSEEDVVWIKGFYFLLARPWRIEGHIMTRCNIDLTPCGYSLSTWTIMLSLKDNRDHQTLMFMNIFSLKFVSIDIKVPK